jgi:hypothetical protein
MTFRMWKEVQSHLSKLEASEATEGGVCPTVSYSRIQDNTVRITPRLYFIPDITDG